MTQVLWRIATDTKDYEADDMGGKGAQATGGRWNEPGTCLVYTSTNIALACLETIVHLKTGGLPLNRYLVKITVPDAVWASAKPLTRAPIGWDAIPEGRASIQAGQKWIVSKASALLLVPSVVVPEEMNVLINPQHDDARKIKAKKIRKWLYDARSVAP